MSSQLELWANELERNQNEVITTLSEAESRLSRHNDSVSQMQAAVYQALEQGEQLAQVIDIFTYCIQTCNNEHNVCCVFIRCWINLELV